MSESVHRISVDKPSVYAFEITGEVTADEMEWMAQTMNAAFDTHDEKVDMLLVFRDFQGSESGSLWDTEVLKSRFRSLANVRRYVVVGAPESAKSMIDSFAMVMPVEAHTYDAGELDKAWALLGTQPAQVD